ncbi:MAG TPA: SMI1/KNR4 family protein [Aggregatilineaceae bacterium]|jgi:hypothetical protein|nr:SMI1/KNR4 family protein [Aggregatilineaceae bacterium]
MTSLENLFAEIEAHHYSEPCTHGSEIDEFARRNNYQFPDDLKAFYRRYRSVRLFDTEFGAKYRFVPISEIHPTRIDIYGIDTDEWGPREWLTVCNVQDGNYIAIDILSKDGDAYNYIDCFHETFAQPGECKIVARSFTELLEHALRGGEGLYYLQPDFAGYGDGRPLTPENAAIRIGNPEAPEKGWLVKFTFKGIAHSRFFSDREHGGEEEAFEAVRRYIGGIGR